MQFTIKPSKELPFYDHGKSLLKTIRNSSKRRKMNFFYFAFRKIENIILYRIAYFCPLNSWRIRMHRWRGVHIGKNVYIGQEVVLDNAYPEYIYICDKVSINQKSMLLTHSNVMGHFEGIITPMVSPILVKEGAMIGIGSIIMPGAIIGIQSVVSAGAVVMKNVPDYTLVGGNPAKKITEFEILLKHKL